MSLVNEDNQVSCKYLSVSSAQMPMCPSAQVSQMPSENSLLNEGPQVSFKYLSVSSTQVPKCPSDQVPQMPRVPTCTSASCAQITQVPLSTQVTNHLSDLSAHMPLKCLSSA